ncbi:MAG: DUF664 domain-containing protein [Armatimonas sp.]
MSHDFSISWEISRGRFDKEVEGLSHEQLRYRLYPNALSIGEMAVHVAGVEIWFINQIQGQPVPTELERIAKTATDGVVNDKPFPFTLSELTPKFVLDTLQTAATLVKEVIYSPTEEQLDRQIQSALGPIIDGRGALARLTFHSAYHQGQAYQIKGAPGFPG